MDAHQVVQARHGERDGHHVVEEGPEDVLPDDPVGLAGEGHGSSVRGGEGRRADVPDAFVKTFGDVIDFVESNYRIIPDKAHRAIAGLSMGGGHAVNISRTKENTFDYIGVFSSAASGDEQFDASIKRQFSNGLKLYWIGIGREDFVLPRNKEFRAKLDNFGLKYTYVETGGGHIWKCWRDYLSQFAPLLFTK